MSRLALSSGTDNWHRSLLQIRSGSMHYRKLGKTNFKVSEVSLGAWQIGVPGRCLGRGCEASPARRDRERNKFYSTPQYVYGDGRSERFIVLDAR